LRISFRKQSEQSEHGHLDALDRRGAEQNHQQTFLYGGRAQFLLVRLALRRDPVDFAEQRAGQIPVEVETVLENRDINRMCG
jgi:hypothetical protein